MRGDVPEFPLRLGFGCSGAWGKPWFPERQARALLLAALEHGVRFVDTAGFYANGEAEARAGRILNEFQESVFVSTKTGTRYTRGGALKDFSEAAIRADVEASLKRLDRERLNLLFLHGPSEAALLGALDVMAALKREGKIARWGVCGAGRGLEAALDARADAIMGVFNFLHQEHEAVFARARREGALVFAIAPLAQGLYRRGFFNIVGIADLWRIARALARNRHELASARAAREVLESVEGFTPAGAALAFAQSNRDIDAAVTTSTNPARLAESLVAAERKLPVEALTKLRALSV